ncbi:hypothetical protein ACO0QE_000192 [Hanseniaspora vineae]
MPTFDDEQYGVVIDAGSSGSRLHIYQFNLNPESSENQEVALKSVPKIITKENWNYKISPGLSSFEHNTENAYKHNIEPLLEHAESIIPKSQWSKTPIFIQATAGMRLIPEKKRNKILENLCSNLQKDRKWLMQSCEAQIEVIDGEVEGVYGWLSLNYLSGFFDDYQEDSYKLHESLGFMDMGGASTQIAFSPVSQEQINAHKDYMSKVVLLNLNGEYQKWDVFVSTWLGFGANQARKRYLSQLVNLLPENVNDYDDDDFKTKTLIDPCLPKNAKQKFKYKNEYPFEIKGSGNYEQCSKSIYPLLLKNLPCDKEPCLFNGVHAPQIDFYNDKFVGVSEYWYTANDIFQLGGEYNFEVFSSHVQKFCETDWSDIQDFSLQGKYNNIPESFLLDSCFKANWILNVLHEGFNLPRIGIDSISQASDANESPVPGKHEKHVPFQSVSDVNGNELSWTLGKILLYACSLIQVSQEPTEITSLVGVSPSLVDAQKSGKTFISGSIFDAASDSASKSPFSSSRASTIPRVSLNGFSIFAIILLFLVAAYLGLQLYVKNTKCGNLPRSILTTITNFQEQLKRKFRLWSFKRYDPFQASRPGGNFKSYSATNVPMSSLDANGLNDLETGVSIKQPRSNNSNEQFQMRSRSMVNLHHHPGDDDDDKGHSKGTQYATTPKSFVSLTDFKTFE